MNKKYKIRIIVPAKTTSFNKQIYVAVKPIIPPDFDVTIKNITEGNDCIQNRYNLTQNALPTVNLAIQTENDGYHGIFVTDFDMCGVEAAREVVNIPVIGGFRASAYTAMMLSERFSIITILNSTIAMQREHINTFSLNERFASIRTIDCDVSTLKDKKKVIALVLKECIKAVDEDGAQSFILGCTGFIGIAEEVGKGLLKHYKKYIPITDPNMIALSYLVLLVRTGMTQSRLCYSKVVP